MAKPNPQLEAALAQFAAQPGTTPDQQAQLRDALTADADRLAQLNQDAALGRITGFALASAGSATQIGRTEEHTSELQSLMRISYAVFCLNKTTNYNSKKIK